MLLDVEKGRISLKYGSDTQQDAYILDLPYEGGATASVSNAKLTVTKSNGSKFFGPFPIDDVYIRNIGGSSYYNPSSGSFLNSIQAVLNRSNNVVVSDDEYNISNFIKPDLTSGHSETTEFVHNGDVDNGGAVILDSNSALIGFQSGTFVKTTENIVGGRPYGRIQVKVDNGAGTGTAVDAIDITQGNIVQYPTVTISGETVFAQDVEFQEDVILTSPNGTKYRLGVDNSGNLSTQAV